MSYFSKFHSKILKTFNNTYPFQKNCKFMNNYFWNASEWHKNWSGLLVIEIIIIASSMPEILLHCLCTCICNNARSVGVIIIPTNSMLQHSYIFAGIFKSMLNQYLHFPAEIKEPTNTYIHTSLCLCLHIASLVLKIYMWFCSFWKICVEFFCCMRISTHFCVFFTDNMPQRSVNLTVGLFFFQIK
jgi:hypothetical protein